MASCVFVVRASVVQLSDFCVHPSLVVAVACALLLHVFPLLVLRVLLFCNIKNQANMSNIGAKVGFWRVWVAIWDPFGPQRTPRSQFWCLLLKFVPSWGAQWRSKMEYFSHVGWLLGALFSIAVLGLFSESVLGGSQTRKVVISLKYVLQNLGF